MQPFCGFFAGSAVRHSSAVVRVLSPVVDVVASAERVLQYYGLQRNLSGKIKMKCISRNALQDPEEGNSLSAWDEADHNASVLDGRRDYSSDPDLTVEFPSFVQPGVKQRMNRSLNAVIKLASEKGWYMFQADILLRDLEAAQLYLSLPEQYRPRNVSVVSTACSKSARALNKTPEETVNEACNIIAMLPKGVSVTAYHSQAIVTREGEFDPVKLLKTAEPYFDTSCSLALVDANGDSTPEQFAVMHKEALKYIALDRLIARVHGSGKSTLVKAAILMLLGVKRWDVALANLGGYGHILDEDKQANLNMADLFELCDEFGVEVPIDPVNRYYWKQELLEKLGVEDKRPVFETLRAEQPYPFETPVQESRDFKCKC